MNRILVLCGGRSAEHEVSLDSASSVISRLDRSRYKVQALGIGKNGESLTPERLRSLLDLKNAADVEFPACRNWIAWMAASRKELDAVFPVLHGPFGEDGTVQGLLELMQVPYVGAGVCASALGMNKIHCKQILRQQGLPVVDWVDFHRSEWEEDKDRQASRVLGSLPLPLFVKPANLGSSVGISKIVETAHLEGAVAKALQFDDWVIVEKGIDAREIEVSVVGNLQPRASLPGEIVPSGDFYSYEAKYVSDQSRLLAPAPLSPEQSRQVRTLALAAYRVLQLEGMARIDFLMDRVSEELFVSEPNTIPGFTRISMYPKLWVASGLSYSDLLTELIELALERFQRRRGLSVER
ncbi:MAG TPA: D-alanine--D-alanine ligase family protein [Acidobacteriota bacterium]|nr:D-alanine--D-alanine ligase family protein [Acidobacteriota bacterium]